SPSQPPALASWMLRHLVLGDRTEAIEGDLLEEFQRRRSAGWYWRQVAGAILGFSNLLRISWVMVWTAAFAAAWIYGLCFFVAHSAPSPVQIVSGNWIPNGRWIPVFSMGIPFYLMLPLCVYLALTRNLNLRAFAAGLGAGILAIVLLPFAQSQLATPFNYFLAWVRFRHGSVSLWFFAYETLQGAWPLLVGMWAATLCRKKTAPPAPSQQAPTP
ncbi:MAG: hypothetical protein WB819_09630, partial [Terriglobia bacterium]